MDVPEEFGFGSINPATNRPLPGHVKDSPGIARAAANDGEEAKVDHARSEKDQPHPRPLSRTERGDRNRIANNRFDLPVCHENYFPANLPAPFSLRAHRYPESQVSYLSPGSLAAKNQRRPRRGSGCRFGGALADRSSRPRELARSATPTRPREASGGKGGG